VRREARGGEEAPARRCKRETSWISHLPRIALGFPEIPGISHRIPGNSGFYDIGSSQLLVWRH